MASNTAASPAGAESDKGTGFAPEAASGGSFFSAANLKRLLGLPLQHWQLSLAACLCSAVLAFVAGQRFSKVLWQAEGLLQYTPLSVSENLKAIPPTDLQTLANMIKLPQNLEVLQEEFGLAMPTEVLDRLIRVNQAPNKAAIISVTLQWEDPETAADLVNRLMELGIQQVDRQRKARIDQYIASLEANLDAGKTRVELALDDLRRFLARANVQDTRLEIDRLDKDITQQEAALNKLRSDQANAAAQIAKLEDSIQKLKAQNEADATADREKGKGSDQKKVQQLLDLDQRIKEARASLREKEAQRLRLKPLVERQFETRDKLETLNTEIAILSERIKTLQKQTASVQEEKSPDDKPATRLLETAMLKKLELEVQQSSYDSETHRLEEGLAARQQQLKKLQELQRQAEPLAKRVEGEELARQQEENQLSALRQLRGLDAGELAVLAPAKPGEQPVAANRIKVTALAFALPLALYLALLAGYDRAVSGGSAEGVARRLGLPVLARIAFPRPGQPPARDADRRLQDEARGLALRIRQYVPGSGGVILLTALREGREVDDLVAQLSRFFGVRDEKVLIVDARIARTRTSGLTRLVDRPALVVGPVESVPTVRDSRSVPAEAAIPGLVQYLVFEGQDPARFIVPTRVPAVDYLPPGAPYAMTDVLATQPMHELLAGLRQKYTLILLVGPPVVGGVDAEILAAYAHGVVVVVNGAADNPDALDDVFRSLREANAPLLGSVVCA